MSVYRVLDDPLFRTARPPQATCDLSSLTSFITSAILSLLRYSTASGSNTEDFNMIDTIEWTATMEVEYTVRSENRIQSRFSDT